MENEEENNPDIEFYHGYGDSSRDQIDSLNMNVISYDKNPPLHKRKIGRKAS